MAFITRCFGSFPEVNSDDQDIVNRTGDTTFALAPGKQSPKLQHASRSDLNFTSPGSDNLDGKHSKALWHKHKTGSGKSLQSEPSKQSRSLFSKDRSPIDSLRSEPSTHYGSQFPAESKFRPPEAPPVSPWMLDTAENPQEFCSPASAFGSPDSQPSPAQSAEALTPIGRSLKSAKVSSSEMSEPEVKKPSVGKHLSSERRSKMAEKRSSSPFVNCRVDQATSSELRKPTSQKSAMSDSALSEISDPAEHDLGAAKSSDVAKVASRRVRVAAKASSDTIAFPPILGVSCPVGIKGGFGSDFTATDEDSIADMLQKFENIAGLMRVPLNQVRLRCSDGKPVMIGTGAFGRVYLGTLFKEACAIKTILQGTRKEQARFLWEIKFLSILRSRFITKYMGFSVCPDGLLLLMEYVSGGTLTESLKRSDEYRWKNSGKKALVQIAVALNVLHGNKILHLDIKSPNILLRESGEVVLADVGLGKLMKSEITCVSKPGSFPWAAFELLQGRASYSADIWSFGTCMWEVCTGERPPMNRLLRPIEVPEEASQEAVDLIEKCHCLAPEDRINAEELYNLLLACPQ